MSMSNEELQHFVDTVAAAAYAAKAITTCELAGLEVTRENLAIIFGHWMNSENPHFEGMVTMIDAHAREIIETANALRPSGNKPH